MARPMYSIASLVVIDLRANDTQEVPGIGIPRIGLEDLTVDLLGLLELAGAMASDGLDEGFGD